MTDLLDRTHATHALLARLRQLTVPGDPKSFRLRLRCALGRRMARRATDVGQVDRVRARWREAWRVACVAGIVVGVSQLLDVLRPRPMAAAIDAESLPRQSAVAVQPGLPRARVDAEAYVEPALPARNRHGDDGAFFDRVDAVTADIGADSVLAWIGARNELEALRNEFRQRFSFEERRSMLVVTGASPAREERIQQLAGAVAAKLEAAPATAEPYALALGLRALLASGSSRTIGEHRVPVRRTTELLLEELKADVPVEVAVSLLAAITDVAVVSGGREGDTVRRHAEQIARATVDLGGEKRPTLLHWQTRLASLADAGYVLRLAPAFGAPAGLCARARKLVLAHLRERLDVRVEKPEVIAAMLYGFGDLVDLAALDARMLLWDAPKLLHDYVALQHYAWGQFPVRNGWANFQDDLRYLSTLPTPVALTDAAALLMTLATNFAAPGSLELIARR